MSARRTSPGQTINQQVLADKITTFVRAVDYGAALITYLARDEVEVVRAEQIKRGHWHLFLVLPSHLQSLFDVDLEVLCVATTFAEVHPRIFRDIQSALRDNQRADRELAMLVSDDPKAERLVRRRAGETAVLALRGADLGEGEERGFRHDLLQTMLTVDHFNVTTPITEPSAFFGRQNDIKEVRQCLDKGQHVGIFGLRKAGKSSLLNQTRSLLVERGWVVAQLDLNEYIGTPRRFKGAVVREMAEAGERTGIPQGRLRSLEERRGSDVVNESWLDDVGRLTKQFESAEGVALIIDEVDVALPARTLSDLGPDEESLGLLRALSQLRGLCQRLQARGDSYPVLLCAGVNPALFEHPQIRGVANPLYQFARLKFIAPLDREELAQMVRTLGKRTGMRFRDAELIDALLREYGGHPLLTRQACSYVHQHRSAVVPYDVAIANVQAAFVARGPGTPLAHALDVPDSFSEWFPEEGRHLARVLGGDLPPLEWRLDYAIAYGLLECDRTIRMNALARGISPVA